MSEHYSVRVSKDTLVFSAGHFITYDGDHCERLHGHNYRVAVELHGPLDANHYVFDFIALKDRAMELILELDHRMLVAMENPLLQVVEQNDEVEIHYHRKRWIFPHEDCALLAIENTTVELLAKYLAGRLLKVLDERHQYVPSSIRVDVEENFGQVASYEFTLEEPRT